MMRLFTILFFSILVAKAQDFSEIKKITDTYSGLMTAEKLAKNINRDFNTDEYKTKALYAWLTKNICYDLKEFYNPNRQTRTSFRYRTEEEKQQKIKAINERIVKKTLTSRKAVCEGFARTFAQVCTLLNIENEVVPGYVRNSFHDIGKPQRSANHAWNAVKINKNWVYIDATWGAGAEFNGRWIRKFNPYYYNIPKEKYFKTHLPEESIWRLRVGRITKEDFYNQPILSNKFLNSGMDLVEPEGILKRDEKGRVQIKLNTINQRYFLWMGEGSPFIPTPIKKEGYYILRTKPSVNADKIFFLLGKDVAAEFLIQ
ncbi:transglutaminase domain-containing protein [Tenacibaculum sp. ZS6-P6]|uniref:transglutaminase domain-containing protein n=1 Tax=Tenacibaculum sp. ZS6-P6 TaxID=3447503 RepID=UPI003F9AF654